MGRLLLPSNKLAVNLPFEDAVRKIPLLSGFFYAKPAFAASRNWKRIHDWPTGFCENGRFLSMKSTMEAPSPRLREKRENSSHQCRPPLTMRMNDSAFSIDPNAFVIRGESHIRKRQVQAISLDDIFRGLD